jgi:hypothetical protein
MMAALWLRLVARPLIPILIALALVGWGLAATFKIQIEGLRIWPIHITGWREENTGLRLDLDTIKAAQIVAAERAAAAKAAEEQRSLQNAERTDSAYQTELARLRDLAGRYASANRVRTKAAYSPPSGTPAPADDHGSQGSDRPGADAVVLDRDDFDIMVENSVRLKAAVEWAKTLNVADPVK